MGAEGVPLLVLRFLAAPGGQIDGDDLALPEEISHWIESVLSSVWKTLILVRVKAVEYNPAGECKRVV